MGGANDQGGLFPSLLSPASYPHPVDEISLLETHISYVLLTGRFAYKIKKAVSMGFLDFSALEQRRFFCEEEVRLNSRITPDLYLAVVPIGTSASGIHLGATEGVVDYAVKMKEFPQSALFDHLLSEGRLLPAQIDQLADRVADFHQRAERAGADDDYGTPPNAWQPVDQTFSRLRAALYVVDPHGDAGAPLDELETWSRKEYVRLEPVLAGRKREGFVRECHGDLHLGNIVYLDDGPRIFDCIEFNAQMRWIDVMNDVAFLVMDFEERGKPEFAYRFLNRYLESTGDYAGLQVLPFYRAYRALVRAMVACLRAAQEDVAAGTAEMETCRRYLTYAQECSLPPKPWLVLMHGLSGSGKTTISQLVLERTRAIRLRSDIERKRLNGIPAMVRREDALNDGLYNEEKTRATYACLARLARTILEAGFPVVVDAASLKSWQRKIFSRQAQTLGVPFRLLCCHADESALPQRLLGRAQYGHDVSDANLVVLRHQQQTTDHLDEEEQGKASWVHDGDEALDAMQSWIGEARAHKGNAD